MPRTRARGMHVVMLLLLGVAPRAANHPSACTTAAGCHPPIFAAIVRHALHAAAATRAAAPRPKAVDAWLATG